MPYGVGWFMEKERRFELVYHEYYQKVFRYIYSRIGSRQEAEDLAQEVFVACYRNFDRYDEKKAGLQTWIYVIMKNKLKNYYRDKKDILSTDDEEQVPEQAGEVYVEEAVLLEEEHRILLKAISTLSEREETIVKNRYFQQYSSVEIGKALNMSDANVRMTLKRSLAKLRSYLEENGY